MVIEKDEIYISGLTWRSLLVVIYGIVVLLPAAIWYQLYTGGNLSSGIQYTLLLLAVELSFLAGKPLTRQESFIIWMLGHQIAFEVIGIQWIYNAWFRASPYSFGLDVPDWWAPPPETNVLITRTFFSPYFVAPILVALLTGVLWKLADMSMAFISKSIFIEAENLPFPTAQVAADAIITLTERPDPKRNKVFLISTALGFIYGLFIYFPILVLEYIVLPIPWIDLTKLVEPIFPGASFGIATDILAIALGFILSPNVVLATFAGGLAFYFIGNYLTSPESPLSWFRGLFSYWSPGSSLLTIYQRSLFQVWVSPLIGFSVAAGILPILRRPRIFIDSVKSLSRIRSGKNVDNYPLWFLLILFFGSTVGSVILTSYLIADLPLTFILLAFALSSGWSFIYTLVGTRSYGIIGIKQDVPYVKEGVFLAYMGLTGFTNTQVWFAPLIITTFGADFCYFMKIGQICNTSSKSMYKAYFLIFPIAWLVSFIYVSVFWRIAPMPSNVYPGTNIYWPVQAQWLRLFASMGSGLLNPLSLLVSFLCAVGIFVFSEVTQISIPLIALAFGMSQPIPYPTALLIGMAIGKLIEHRVGKEFWMSFRNTIVAGLSLGTGLIITLSVAIKLILKNIWILPY